MPEEHAEGWLQQLRDVNEQLLLNALQLQETASADRTVSRESAQRLEESETRYRLLAEQSVELIMRWSPEEQLEYVSPSHQGILGWRPDEMEGHPTADFVHPDDTANVTAHLVGTVPGSAVSRVRHKAGHYVWLEARSTPLRNADGGIVGYQVAARDVTEQRADEEQARYAQKMDALGRMARGVAHQFNNLLTVIQSASQLLQTESVSVRESSELLGDIVLATDRAADLTAQLLTFARDSHTVPACLNVVSLLERALPVLCRLAGPDVLVALSWADDAAAAMIDAEAAQVELVVTNLVVNAVDAMPSGGTLRIHCDVVEAHAPRAHRHGSLPAGRYVRVSISDTGTGMTDAVMTSLFDPFFTTKELGKGTGLGLAMVLGSVQHSGGTVIVQSVLGAGSVFAVYWPYAAPQAPDMALVRGTALLAAPSSSGAQPAPPALGHVERRRAVVVVDDEAVVRGVVARVLRHAGFVVRIAESGLAALVLLREERADVCALVTDIRMPGMSGVELVEALRTEGIDMPVLFMSGQLSTPMPAHWPTTVPRMFIGKPFTANDLTRAVERLIALAGVRAE